MQSAGRALWVIVYEGKQPPSEETCRTWLGHEERIVVVACAQRNVAQSLRTRWADRGDLGRRAFVIEFAERRLPIADGLADVVIWQGDQWNEQLRSELFRVAHPGATVSVVDRTWTAPRPPGSDDWSHPYHGPDNNPLSQDVHSEGPYLTQFLTEPWYVPMPEVTVASGGRLFKAFGHIALKKREWPWLNKLVAINGFNGLLLWSRDLMPGFNIHR
ncbi:MAG TPA: hypothetical protein ENJ16_02440, partial [Planctomycetaceae bacterium]|nr:hypothetical protein [Planctomycetaceae bacterium]